MTLDKFIQLISDVSHVPVKRITEESSFRDDLGIDSLQMVNLLTHCFEVFRVEMGVIKDSNDLKTVGNLYLAFNLGGK